MKNLISVVMPAFNAEKTIGEAIESVLSQVDVSVELLVTNDASTDATAEICRRAASGEARMRVLEHKSGERRGVGASRQLALDRAEGSLVAFLDADDVFLPGRLAFQRDLLARYPRAVLAHGGVTAFGPARQLGQQIEAWMKIADDESYYWLWKQRAALRENRVANSTVLARRTFLKRVRIPRIRFQYEDWGTWLLLARFGPFVYHPRPVVRYRAHPDSFTFRHMAGGRRAHLKAALELMGALERALPRLSRAHWRVFAERQRLQAILRGS